MGFTACGNEPRARSDPSVIAQYPTLGFFFSDTVLSVSFSA